MKVKLVYRKEGQNGGRIEGMKKGIKEGKRKE